MTILFTGSTGFLGSYVLDELLRRQDGRVSLLVRAWDRDQAVDKLWRAMQLHWDGRRFWEMLERVDFVHGDLSAPGLGLAPEDRDRLLDSTDSIVHMAASLNRKSSRVCFDVNLRGTLSVLKLARSIADHGGLRRFSHTTAIAVAGERDREHVHEDEAIDWKRRQHDPYAQTKMFCEHMVDELLPDVSTLTFRPPTVMGDSRRPETTQFDMVRAFCTLAEWPVLPFRGDGVVEIVNADYVGEAIATLHLAEAPAHDVYHVTAGERAVRCDAITEALATSVGLRPPRFAPSLGGTFTGALDAVDALPMRNGLTHVAALLKVFWPYVTNDTTYDNRRIVEALGHEPVPFTEYCGPLYRWAREVGFEFPYRPLPSRPERVAVPREAALR